MGQRRAVYRFLVRKSEGRDYLEDPGVDARVTLRWTFMKWGGEYGLD